MSERHTLFTHARARASSLSVGRPSCPKVAISQASVPGVFSAQPAAASEPVPVPCVDALETFSEHLLEPLALFAEADAALAQSNATVAHFARDAERADLADAPKKKPAAVKKIWIPPRVHVRPARRAPHEALLPCGAF